MIAVSKDIEVVTLQFRLTNGHAIPKGVPELMDESAEEKKYREQMASFATGKLIIPPVENCSLAELIDRLNSMGFCVVDAFQQQRRDRGPAYYVARFDLRRTQGCAQHKRLEESQMALQEMVATAMWKAQVWRNPYFMEGQEIVGQFALSINMVARQPLVHADGTPILARPEESRGDKSVMPLPIKPKHILTISQGALVARAA